VRKSRCISSTVHHPTRLPWCSNGAHIAAQNCASLTPFLPSLHRTPLIFASANATTIILFFGFICITAAASSYTGFYSKSVEMRLFLTVIPLTPVRGGQSGAAAVSPDTVTLFDDGVWTRSGPSPQAIKHVAAAFVAQEMHRKAALTELVYMAKNGVVCFRFGPRASPQRDCLFFHKRRSPSFGFPKSPLARGAPSAESAGMSSPLITPSTSFSSERIGKSLPSSSLVRSSEQEMPLLPTTSTTTTSTTTFTTSMYESLFSLWLREVIQVKRQHVTVSGCVLFVDGTAIDLSTRRVVHAPLSNTHAGATCVLRCADDAHAFLAQCEQAVTELAGRCTPPVPYHMWVTVHLGAVSGEADTTDELPWVTFLDLASTADCAGESEITRAYATRVREQLRLFERQLGTPASMSAPEQRTSPLDITTTADRRWLGFLQSCQLTRAKIVGIFSLTEEAGRSVFSATTSDGDHDVFAWSAELRQRALEEAVNSGVVHPTHAAVRDRTRRTKKKTKRVATDALTSHQPASVKCVSPTSQLHEPFLATSPQLPSLRSMPQPLPLPLRNSRSCQSLDETSHSSSRSGTSSAARFVDLVGRLVAEETAARSALMSSETRARDLRWMRWALRAHPPHTSATCIARQLSSAASVLVRPKIHSAPSKRPPPLAQADLAATAGAQWKHRGGNGHSYSTTPAYSASRSPAAAPRRRKSCSEVVHEALPLITPPPSTSHATSGLLTPSHRRPTAVGTAVRPVLHPEFLSAAERCSSYFAGGNEGFVTPQFCASPSRGASGTHRRYSALEVALLERAHSCAAQSPSAISPHNGSEVELLYPLVRAFHAEVTAQDTLMAAEFMARSKVELREMNYRRTIENLAAERGKVVASTVCPPVLSGRRYPASPRVSRVFFDV
jgi:hypothetical protein